MLYKKILLSCCLSLISTLIFSQKNTDVNFLFKMWFFMEKRNVNLKGLNDFPVKDSSLFFLFSNSIKFKIDTLKTSGFPDDYQFLAILVKKENLNSDSAITEINQNIVGDHKWYISIPINCDKYVLCINLRNGLSYRLAGFHGNDFIIFLEDIKNRYYNDHFLKLKMAEFFKNFKVEGIDFNCIYKGLKAINYDKNKYPCLHSCEDNIIIFPSRK